MPNLYVSEPGVQFFHTSFFIRESEDGEIKRSLRVEAMVGRVILVLGEGGREGGREEGEVGEQGRVGK